MRRSVLLFLCLAALALLAGPVVNLWPSRQASVTSADTESLPWWSRTNLYRLDFLMPWLGRLAYPLGISISPDQVIIGRDDWLYLGDKDEYAHGISTQRNLATVEDLASIRRIVKASTAWRDWLEIRGVKLYRIQLAPNKSSIYSEYLPRWARSVPGNPISQMLGQVSPSIYVNNIPSMLEAKTRFGVPLYYRTDSHWNALGAWVGYRDIAFSIESAGKHEIRWLTSDQIRLSVFKSKGGHDLASFLWLGDVLEDTEIAVDIDIGRSLPTSQLDFETGEFANRSDNPRVYAPKHPLLVRSPNALNQARVLWLRDSFGTAMAPFMAATFSEILQVHYGSAPPEIFARLVREFRPDYVIVTVVERASLLNRFQLSPLELLSP